MKSETDSQTGAELLVNELKTAGVDTVFCITGAGNLAIVDAIEREKSIKIIYSHHEQASVMAAQGFARVTGKIGVALVTTGGGSSNALTGILSAYLDSVPLLIISGNESSFHCANTSNLRAYGVQGFDSVSTFKNVTKSAQRISDMREISNNTRDAIYLALSDRMGPCHIDFPMDLQRKRIEPQNERTIKNISKNNVVTDSRFLQTLSQSLAKRKGCPLFRKWHSI
jgi:acetolactate synthase-1/2/3 large subunit